MLPMFKTVMSSVFKKSATVLYPAEQKEQPAGMRGHVLNHIDRCIFCGICQRRCPTGAIEVSREDKTWSISQFECVQCNHCVEVCPQKCLEMSAARPQAVTEKVPHTTHLPDKA